MEKIIYKNTDFTEEDRGYVWIDNQGDEWRCDHGGWWEYYVCSDIWDPSTVSNGLPYADRAPFTRSEPYVAPAPRQSILFRNL